MAVMLVVAVGVEAAVSSETGHTETCALSPYHGGVTFPVETVQSNWTCRLQEVLDNSVVLSSIGPIKVALAESLYHYLLDRPPLAAELIKRLDLGLYESKTRGSDQFWGDDGEGTKGIVQLVYQDSTSRVYYLEGSHDNRFLPSITGKAVVFLRMNPVREPAGMESMNNTVVAYTKLDNRFFSAVASVLRPLVESIVTRKLRKAIETVNQLGLVMRQHPERVLSEAAASPAFADADVAFLKETFAGQQKMEHRGDDIPRLS